ncbi:unnamed protein product [Protopolystoma xenopodis]|uniref:Uncharacterized protein n=1 Tax=Protopolystoma xenopodis TaxID=117903 RepID=A0A3S5AHS3_9PLAT|nr:unnamed protein product [Protopolystoma xenopodis]
MALSLGLANLADKAISLPGSVKSTIANLVGLPTLVGYSAATFETTDAASPTSPFISDPAPASTPAFSSLVLGSCSHSDNLVTKADSTVMLPDQIVNLSSSFDDENQEDSDGEDAEQVRLGAKIGLHCQS